MRKFYQTLASLMAAVMILSIFAGCGSEAKGGKETTAASIQESQQSTQAAVTTEARKEVTLKVLVPSGQDIAPGIQDTIIGKEIARITGVTLDCIVADEEKFKLLAAGGDLPDIINIGSSGNIAETLVSSGQVIPLNDLIEQYGPNIKKNNSGSIKYKDNVLKNANGNVYYIFTQVGKENPDIISYTGFVGFFTRWDLYKAVGAPEMKNEDDYLNTLKLMQDKQPKTADGKKVYALSGWSDWGLWPYTIAYPFMHGYTNWSHNTSIDFEGKAENDLIDSNSIFWKGLEFFNKAYRMGIFDPEAFTMKSDNYANKINSGEVLVSYASWWTGDEATKEAVCRLIPGPFPAIPGVYPSDAPLGYGLGNSNAITSNCKNPVEAMKFLDFVNSTEGCRILVNGVKGKDWDIVDGKPEYFEESAKAKSADAASWRKTYGWYGILAGLTGQYPSEDGAPVDLSASSEVIIKNSVDKIEDFCKFYGDEYKYPGQVYDNLIKNGKAITSTRFFPEYSIMPATSDETTKIDAKAMEYMIANIAKIIMAKSADEFAKAKAQAINDFISMGADKAYQEVLDLLETTRATLK